MTLDVNYARIRKITLRNTLFAFLGYQIPVGGSFIACLLGLARISLLHLSMVYILIMLTTLVFVIVILSKKRFTAAFGNIMGFVQLINWLLLFTFWSLALNEIRFIALISAFIAIVFLMAYATFIQSLVISLFAITSYIGVSYVAIGHLGQSGTFSHEIFYAIFFLPASFYVSYMSGQFKRQREEIATAKKSAESARDALWGEMELAKKIQTILLPENPNIAGYDIAVHMVPCHEVGGDYYDVIEICGRKWIVIGDVSGHGVSAGLIMMMVRTSIHVLLAENPDLPPARILEVINGAISDSISKIGDDRYMTITVLACFEDGVFTFSGLHQDILIYRHNSDRVETVGTDGIWLGITVDMCRGSANDRFALKQGDTMLLFTDGITEAFNTNGEMFGQSRLEETFLALGRSTVVEIRDGILGALGGFVMHDDVTMVVVRRLRESIEAVGSGNRLRSAG